MKHIILLDLFILITACNLADNAFDEAECRIDGDCPALQVCRASHCLSGPIISVADTGMQSCQQSIPATMSDCEEAHPVSGPACEDRDYCGQDGQYNLFSRQGWNAPEDRFVSPAAINGDPSIEDLFTGLQWQQGRSDNPLTWDQAVAYCADLDYAGQKDWRLAYLPEWTSLFDYEPAARAHPALYSLLQLDADEEETQYWTATRPWAEPLPPLTDNELMVQSVLPLMAQWEKTEHRTKLYARCLRNTRGPQKLPRYSVRDDGLSILDKWTALEWTATKQDVDGWPQALSHCEALSLEGEDDWRLPNINALLSIIDYDSLDFRLSLPLNNQAAQAFDRALWTSTPSWMGNSQDGPSYQHVYTLDSIGAQQVYAADLSPLVNGPQVLCVRGLPFAASEL